MPSNSNKAKQFKRQEAARRTVKDLSKPDESLLVTIIFSTDAVQRGTPQGFEIEPGSALVRFPGGGVALNLADSPEDSFDKFERLLNKNGVMLSRPPIEETFDYDVVTDDGTKTVTARQRIYKFNLATHGDVDRLAAVAMDSVGWGTTEFRFGLNQAVDQKTVMKSLKANNHVVDADVTDGTWTVTFRHSASLFVGDNPQKKFSIYSLTEENLEKCLYRIAQGTVGRAMSVANPAAVVDAVQTLVNARSLRRPIVGDKTPAKIREINETIDQLVAMLKTVLANTQDGLKVKRQLANALSRVFKQLAVAPQKKTWDEDTRSHKVSDINVGQFMGNLCRHADSLDRDPIGYKASLVGKTAETANAVLNALETLFAEDGILESVSIELVDSHIVPEDDEDVEYDEVEADDEVEVEEDVPVGRTLSAAAH
jgi:hypothetical protein